MQPDKRHAAVRGFRPGIWHHLKPAIRDDIGRQRFLGSATTLVRVRFYCGDIRGALEGPVRVLYSPAKITAARAPSTAPSIVPTNTLPSVCVV